MKNNKTDATNVLKFFREAKEARQGEQNNLDMMSYGGTDDPPNDLPTDPPTGPTRRVTPWEQKVKAREEERKRVKNLSYPDLLAYNEKSREKQGRKQIIK